MKEAVFTLWILIHLVISNDRNDGVWVGHLLSGYTLPMEDPGQSKVVKDAKGIGGTWKQSIKTAFEATKLAFPGGEIIAHLDHK